MSLWGIDCVKPLTSFTLRVPRKILSFPSGSGGFGLAPFPLNEAGLRGPERIDIERPRLQEHPRTQPSERALDSSRHAGMTLVPTPKRLKECARFSGLLQAIGLRQKAELPSGATSLLMKVNYDKVQVEVYDWWERKLAAFQMTTLQVRYVTHRRIGSSL